MKKFKYRVLQVNNIIVENQITGEIINIDNSTTDEELKKIINKVDNMDLIVGDEFNVK